ncbi:hypothetical protein [Microbulbifer sp. JMSA002]|uniref:hypothetical protein n=1 Tax=Microbulbifer sp. JMSA002 TaxID=3243368 RepID=UPI00403A71D0
MLSKSLFEPMTFVVGYSYTGWVITLILLCVLGFFSYKIFILERECELWKFESVKWLLIGWVFLTLFALTLTLSECFTIYKHRKALKEGDVNYAEGRVVYGKIPFSWKEKNGPQRPVAKIDDILFTLRRSPSECINKLLSEGVVGDYQKRLTYRVWYVEKSGVNTFKGLQDFTPCVVKLEILPE